MNKLELTSFGAPNSCRYRLTDNVGFLVIYTYNGKKRINHLFATDDTLTETNTDIWFKALNNQDLFSAIIYLMNNKDDIMDRLEIDKQHSVITEKDCVGLLIQELNRRGYNERSNI